MVVWAGTTKGVGALYDDDSSVGDAIVVASSVLVVVAGVTVSVAAACCAAKLQATAKTRKSERSSLRRPTGPGSNSIYFFREYDDLFPGQFVLDALDDDVQMVWFVHIVQIVCLQAENWAEVEGLHPFFVECVQ